MTLGKDNCAFQDRYYVVGTGVVRMRVNWSVCGDGLNYRRDRLDQRGRGRDVAPHGARSSGWLVRLFGHVRTSVASHRGGSRNR